MNNFCQYNFEFPSPIYNSSVSTRSVDIHKFTIVPVPVAAHARNLSGYYSFSVEGIEKNFLNLFFQIFIWVEVLAFQMYFVGILYSENNHSQN